VIGVETAVTPEPGGRSIAPDCSRDAANGGVDRGIVCSAAIRNRKPVNERTVEP
jgi:hypothetical protein